MPKIIRERDVEKYFVAEVEKAGGEVRKVKWIGRSGAPDRFAALNGAHFVELKAPGEKLEPHQAREHKRLRDNGVSVGVIDSFALVDQFVEAKA